MMNRGVMQRQMFRGGGEAVPNQYKGFSKLPENVQQKMNPALAKRYQQGGIASMMDPASLPQGAPMAGGMPQGGQMDPAQMAMMEAEQAGRAQGEQLGAMVGEQTMMGLNQAEDFKGAIDAIRGNNAPMEARYQELSEYVGPQDAMQTPESVLAMVQPTIMMTEEGAVDSGIGQLMQQITGNVEMETPDGQPTAMAEGVGSLMGVGQQPAEKKFLADGGAVQKFASGLEVKPIGGGVVPMTDYQTSQLPQYLQETQKFYKEILGDPQEQKKAMQANILFNLADRGLALAGGVDPRTGESMAGAPILSQLGRAGAGLGAQIGEQLAQQRALEQNIGLQALKSAEAKEAAYRQTVASERAMSYDQQSKLALKNLDQEFVRAENQSARDHEKELLAVKKDIEKALIYARGADSRLSAVQQNQLNKNLAKFNSKLEENRAQINHENDLEKLGIINGYDLFKMGAAFDFDIAKMDKGQEFAKELANHSFELDKIKQRTQNSFTAGQAYLADQRDTNRMITQFELNEALTLKIKEMDIEEREKDRMIDEMKEKNNRIFQQQSLNIEKLKYALDKEYKGALVAIDKAKANAVEITTKGRNNTFTFLSEGDRMERYANGDTDTSLVGNNKETMLINDAIATLQTSKSYFDDSGFQVMTSVPELNPEVKNAIISRMKLGLTVPTIKGLTEGYTGKPTNFKDGKLSLIEASEVGGQPSDEVVSDEVASVVDLSAIKPANPNYERQTKGARAGEKVSEYMSPEFKRGLFTPEGGVNFNSPEWDRIPTTIVQPEIPYYKATGPASIMQRVSNFANEYLGEFFNFDPMSREGKDIVEADADFDALRESALQVINNLSDDRVLAKTQDALRRAFQGLEGGVLKNDEKTLGQLRALKESLGIAFSNYANADPDYNPKAVGAFKTEQFTKNRRDLIKIVNIIAEVRKMEGIYESYINSRRSGSGTKTDSREVRQKILQMQRKN